jgi:hypothetical protein
VIGAGNRVGDRPRLHTIYNALNLRSKRRVLLCSLCTATGISVSIKAGLDDLIRCLPSGCGSLLDRPSCGDQTGITFATRFSNQCIDEVFTGH